MGIFKTEDEGETWNEWVDESSGLTHPKVHDLFDVLYDETPVLQIKFCSINPNIIYAVTAKNIIRSIDGGSDWANVWKNDVTNPLSVIALNT